MAGGTTLEKIRDKIKIYDGSVKQSSIGDHVSFLSSMGAAFAKISGSDFDIRILKSMESVIKKILDDIESGRHEAPIDNDTKMAIEDLIDLNVGLVRGLKKDLDVSEDWNKRLRTYIKILRNLSIAAIIITSNDEIPKNENPLSDMKTIFNWHQYK